MEIQLVYTQTTRSESEEGLELSLYDLGNNHLVPLLAGFIEDYINWSFMSKEECTTQKMTELFNVKVIAVM